MNLRPPFDRFFVLASCNGLICVNASLEMINQPFFEPAYICNPVTREYVVLPYFQIKVLLIGFGYVPSTNKYKVVRICNNERDPNFGIVQVYTLGSGIGWRNAKKKMAYDVNGLYVSHHRSGVFANGAIHWVDDRGIVVAFILADEEFRERPSPLCSRQIGNLRPILELHVFDDYLCVYVCQQDRGFDIRVLKKNQNYHDVCIWSKGFSNLPWYNLPITFTMSGRLLCHDARDKNVYHYAPEASSSRCLVNFGKNFEIGIPHKNTLVSLKALGEEETKLMDSGERARSSGGQKTVISQKEQKEETNI